MLSTLPVSLLLTITNCIPPLLHPHFISFHFPPPQFRSNPPLIPMYQPINPLQCLRASRHKPRTQRKQPNPPHSIQMRKDWIRIEAVAGMTRLDPEPVSECYSCGEEECMEGADGPGWGVEDIVHRQKEGGEEVES